MNKNTYPRSLIPLGSLMVFLLVSFISLSEGKAGPVKCELVFSLHTWSFFYKSGHGTGTVSCDNGQKADVKVRTKGGGITLGASDTTEGHGNFTGATDIKQLFGDYSSAQIGAGVVKTANAQTLGKGKITLNITEIGKGANIGFSFGSFNLTEAKASPTTPPVPSE